MRQGRRWGVILAALLLLVPGGVGAQQRGPGGMTQVTGTVQAVDAKAKTVTLLVAKFRQGTQGATWQEASKDVPGATVKEGKVLLTVQTSEQTRFRGSQGPQGSLADLNLKAGAALMVSYAVENSRAVAIGVRVVPSVETQAPEGAGPSRPAPPPRTQ